jgi:diadenosine tetraphosphate (Ap4A) HIT family hydrolase
MTEPGERQTARSPEVQAAYDRLRERLYEEYGDNAPCPFCDTDDRVVIDAAETMVVYRNDFPYEYLDGQLIQEHLLLVPRRHLGLLRDFTREERDDYWELLATYHQAGYSSLTRSATDTHRSVPLHLHTHLLLYKE